MFFPLLYRAIEGVKLMGLRESIYVWLFCVLSAFDYNLGLGEGYGQTSNMPLSDQFTLTKKITCSYVLFPYRNTSTIILLVHALWNIIIKLNCKYITIYYYSLHPNKSVTIYHFCPSQSKCLIFF